MDHFSHSSYVDLILVACGFLIVFMTKYAFSDSEKKSESRRRHSYFNHTNRISSSGSNRRNSFSHSPTGGYAKRRGRRTFGIKHL